MIEIIYIPGTRLHDTIYLERLSPLDLRKVETGETLSEKESLQLIYEDGDKEIVLNKKFNTLDELKKANCQYYMQVPPAFDGKKFVTYFLAR